MPDRPTAERGHLPASIFERNRVWRWRNHPKTSENLIFCELRNFNSETSSLVTLPSSEESCELLVQRRSDLADIGRKAWMMLSFCIVPSSSLLGTGNRPSVMRRLPAAQPFPTGTFSVDGTGGPEGQKVEGNSWRTST